MDRHDPSGRTLAVHSVCVSSLHRRRRIATSLLRTYLSRASDDGRVDRVVLICHQELIPLYEAAGFTLVGKSDVQHGERQWYEMFVDVASSPSSSEKPSLPTDSGALSALLAASASRDKTLPTTALTEADQKGDAVCPAPGCGCIIFKSGAARWTDDPRLDVRPCPPHLLRSRLTRDAGL